MSRGRDIGSVAWLVVAALAAVALITVEVMIDHLQEGLGLWLFLFFNPMLAVGMAITGAAYLVTPSDPAPAATRRPDPDQPPAMRGSRSL